MQKRLLLAAGLVTLAFGARAQQQPQFSHYGFNGMYISPAYAGINNHPEFTFLGRYQYAGYSADFGDSGGSPQTFLLTGSLPINALKGGIGIQVFGDKAGPLSLTNAAISYSYHIKMGEGKLGIGVQGIWNGLRFGEGLRPKDLNDPNVPLPSNDSKFDAGAGLWYQGTNLYVGAGVNNLIANQFKFESERLNADSVKVKSTGNWSAERHAYLTAGYNFDLSPSFVLTPTAIAKMDFAGSSKSMSFEAGARGTFNDRFWAGVGYRHEEALTGLLGVAFGKNNMVRVGYAFDLVVIDPEARSRTSHEIMLGLRLPEPVIRFRPAVRTPRYSY